MTNTLLPPATIGMIGGGQLGMMTLREARRMGYRSIVWDSDPECPASKVAERTITAPFEDTQAAEQLGRSSDVVTYEFENIDAQTVETIESNKPVFPGSPILRIAQHRGVEKEALLKAGFPVVRFLSASTADGLKTAVREIGYPVVVKTSTTGYDGKGQSVLRTGEELESFLKKEGEQFAERVVEQFLPLQLEISVIAVRGREGTVTTFPVLENEHRENILHVTRVPAELPADLAQKATDLGRAVIEHFRIVGVLCVEMFVTHDGRLLVNELAPRPHNSGHFSLDASSVSQFEALVRCVCGLPIHQPRLLSPCAMVNLLGKHLQRLDLAEVQKIEGAKIHLYGKSRREPKRKMGHMTVLGRSRPEVEEKVQKLERLIGEEANAVVRSPGGKLTRTSVTAV
ncbi:MAG: 5-(carboxyamino)imidazole ribonucleotide synthase [Ignavibacteriales bacterium]|nr:5-(carboxyamino)imidazole ribonucleotide synthase [Ignavibacteriales bacterium]